MFRWDFSYNMRSSKKHLSFYVWPISFTMASSPSIAFATKWQDTIPSFHWIASLVFIDILFRHSFCDSLLVGFHILAVWKGSVKNMLGQRSLWYNDFMSFVYLYLRLYLQSWDCWVIWQFFFPFLKISA